MRVLCHVCCGLVIAATAVDLDAQERRIRAQHGANSVDVVLATSRLEIRPDGGRGTPSAWNYADLQCARYTKEREPLPGWGPIDVLTSAGKWLKNFFAKDTMDHFVDVVPKVGQPVRLRLSDSDVRSVNDGLKAGGVRQCEANVSLDRRPVLAWSTELLTGVDHAE